MASLPGVLRRFAGGAFVGAWRRESLVGERYPCACVRVGRRGAENLPSILKGEKLPRYSVMYGGIDAFNAQMTAQKANLSLSEVLEQLNDTR